MEYRMVEEFCKEKGLTIDQFYGREVFNGDLLKSLTSIPEGFNPIVGGNLGLYSLKSIPEGFNPIVGSYLYLNSLTNIPEWFNPIVGGNLHLNLLKSIPKWFNPIVGGSIYYNGDDVKDIDNPVIKIIRLDKGYIKIGGYIGSYFGKIIEENDKYYKIKHINNINPNKELYVCYSGTEFGIGEYLPDAMIDLKNKLSYGK